MSTVSTDRRPLAEFLVDSLRTTRRLHQSVGALREALQVAVEMLQERDRQLDVARRANLALRAELRAVFSGRTNGDERLMLDRELLDAEYGHPPDAEAAA